MNAHLDAVVRTQPGGRPAGITSVCSAHPLVIEAALRQGVADGSPVLIEATSNQVDQFGGYTGLRPADFRSLVEDIAGRVGLPTGDLVLGGDHLGPHRWRDRRRRRRRCRTPRTWSGPTSPPATPSSTSTAATRAPTTGARSTDEVMAARAARMLVAAEDEAARVGPGRGAPLRDRHRGPGAGRRRPRDRPPGADDARTRPAPPSTTTATAFAAVGRSADVWPQVMALVVQPGVEFDHLRVFDYRPEATARAADRASTTSRPWSSRRTPPTTRPAEALTVAGRRRLGGAQGRARPHLRAARGAVRPRRDRGRAAAGRRALTAARRSSRRACSPSPDQWEGYYTGTPRSRRSPAATATATGCATTGRTPRSRRGRDAPESLTDRGHPRPAAERVPPGPVRTRPVRCAPARAQGAGHRPGARRAAHLRRGRHSVEPSRPRKRSASTTTRVISPVPTRGRPRPPGRSR